METFVRESNVLVYITVNGETIITTPTHPFYVPQFGWTDASDLRAGDMLVLVNGEYAIIEQIEHEILEEPVTVYNFEVEDFHTYHVSKHGVLVHNANYGQMPDVGRSAGNIGEQLSNSVSNNKLKNCINQLYRPGATIGDGGLADAIRHELTTGELVGGKSHITKGLERIRNLENIIVKQDLDSNDLKTAMDLLDDLKSALEIGGY